MDGDPHLDTPGLRSESPQVLAAPPLQPAAVRTSKVSTVASPNDPPSPTGQEGHSSLYIKIHAKTNLHTPCGLLLATTHPSVQKTGI